jgi:nucleoside-diphosphate-sugar epimerase
MNTTASVQLAQRCRDLGIRRYIYASSCSIYDRGVADEERDVLLDEAAEVDPQASYSGSKFAAERELLPLADKNFCVVALRKGTVFGFSPRMRYDLVVNTFVKDAMTSGKITIHYGGEMWRPLVDVRDAARAYVTLLQADTNLINGQVFNLVHRNYRISELALRVREALAEDGVKAEIKTDYAYKGIRNYRVSGRKLEKVLGFRPEITVEQSVHTLVTEIRRHGFTDFDHPRYYNIRWMRLLEEAQHVLGTQHSVFDAE